MKINNIEVDYYIENLDGGIEDLSLIESFEDGWNLYSREDGREFIVKNYGSKVVDDEELVEYIYCVV
jgi:hypothetical protein